MTDPSDPGRAPDDDGVGVSTPDSPQRDDAGRTDRDAGFAIQARIFSAIGLWLAAVSVGYGFLTYEWAGTTMLTVASLLAFTIGAYVGWKGPTAHVTSDEVEPAHGDEEPWFPAVSGWPIVLALGIVLVANGLLLGAWLLAPAAAVTTFAIGGFVVQSRVRG